MVPNIKISDKSDKKPIRLTKQNNVQWDVDIPAGETKDIVLKYSVDHPAAEEVDTSLTTIGTSTTL